MIGIALPATERASTTAARDRAGTAPRAPAERPPAIILGGGANSLSIARSLGRHGVSCYAINKPNAPIRYSRFARWIDLPHGGSPENRWGEFLLGHRSEHLRGAVLLAASDEALEWVNRNRPALEERYLLDDCNVAAARCMLNKLATYRAAQEAGVPTPRFWTAENRAELHALRDALVYPLIVKPQLSHLFEQRFGMKFFVAENFDQLLAAMDKLEDENLQVMLVEKIPGPDDRLCSYYTYLDDNQQPLFHFTKRIIRRFPPNMGLASYHITDWNPEVRDVALRLLQHVKLRGLANVEFKRDVRDGQLKLIECNARFTAANCLVSRSGFDLPRFVYNRLVGLPNPPLVQYRTGERLWLPTRDVRAFWELRRRGELSVLGWLRSIMHRQALSVFQWSDPLPTVAGPINRVRKLLGWPRRAFNEPLTVSNHPVSESHEAA